MPKIFVVDDDLDLVYMIKEMLAKSGYEVATAYDGHEALKAVKTYVPDLMIVDLTMPQMDGWRLSMKVRQDERYKDLPIIVLSGLVADTETSPREPYESYNVLMAKPFDIFKLVEKVKELLAEKEKQMIK